MKRSLRILSVFVLYVPNLAFVGFVLLNMMMGSPEHQAAGRADMAEFTRTMHMAGLGVFAATVFGMVSKRGFVRVPLAFLLAGLSVLFFLGIIGEPGADGKAALFGMGMVLAVFLVTLLCLAVARILTWTAAKMPG